MHPFVRKGVVAGILILAASLWFGRSSIIRHVADSKLEKLEKKFHLGIQYRKMYLEGLNTLQIKELSVVPEGQDTLLYAGSFRITLALGELFLFRPQVERIDADNLHIHFIKKENSSNFDFLYQTATPKQEAVTETNKERNYARKMKKTLDMVFKLLPANATSHGLCVSYSNKGDELQIEIPDFAIADSRFSTLIRSTENKVTSEWIAEGSLQDRQRKINARLYAKENTKISLPFLNYRWGAQVQFDTLAFRMEELKTKADIQRLTGEAYVSGLTIHQERISPDTVLLDRGSFSWQVNVGTDYLELDSTTEVSFNHLNFHPYLKVQRDTSWHVTAAVDKRDFPANELFASLPKGLFYNLEGITAEGTLSYHFLLDVDFGQIDSLLFESTLTSQGFRILNYGSTNLSKMNEPFLYTAYEKGEPVRTFEVGPASSSFRPLHAISRYLPLAIMQSEDAGFYQHAGFIPSAFRESLILDLKERRFARGGSTISMQLVKNVFLSRNKTIARKLEEIGIVWLIENNRLTPKERMFEVYLNIIEWGPLIYGASEASHFYFGKETSELTLSECIFLASIVPKPKHFRSCFDGATLKPYYDGFFNIILTRLIDRERIAPSEAEGVSPSAVKITGPAREYLDQGNSISTLVPLPSSEEIRTEAP